MRVSIVVVLFLQCFQCDALPKWLQRLFPMMDKKSRVITRVLENFKQEEYYGTLNVKPRATQAQLKKACVPVASARPCTRFCAGTERWPWPYIPIKTTTRVHRRHVSRAPLDARRLPTQSRAGNAFDAVRDAYDVLSEPIARAQYDQRRTYRLEQEKERRLERREDNKDAVGGFVGHAWSSGRGVLRKTTFLADPRDVPPQVQVLLALRLALGQDAPRIAVEVALERNFRRALGASPFYTPFKTSAAVPGLYSGPQVRGFTRGGYVWLE